MKGQKMGYAKLEDAINQLIRECLTTEDEIEDAKMYFKNITFNEMIDEAFEE
jgi:hypothetical protein